MYVVNIIDRTYKGQLVYVNIIDRTYKGQLVYVANIIDRT
jgi:hypothetical protein